ncbi:unnamed protein product [Chironomus riparius]|uniref:Uncharacterized protein n=1 Tax=Chironomus riparius TaxID=315576 RepID=A0A9N9RNR7_9DIPT|nr:unnamed protein product [Chironomus riparius]
MHNDSDSEKMFKKYFLINFYILLLKKSCYPLYYGLSF